MLFPYIAQWFSAKNQQIAIKTYFDNTNNIAQDDINNRIDDVSAYNNIVRQQSYDKNRDSYIDEYRNYSKELDVDGNNIICVVEVPKINVKLPVYGGISDAELEKGAGHLEGSSFPVGGNGTHCCISAHRGLAYSLMFRDLDQLEKGDKFYIYVFDRKLTYTVDDIATVEPEDISKLKIYENKDYVTLITCTPYAVNTHRLLVRGVRSE